MNEYKEIITEVISAIEGIKECVKEDISKNKCHMISRARVEDFYIVLEKIRTIIVRMKWNNESFNNAYNRVVELLEDYDLCAVSIAFENEMIGLLDETIKEFFLLKEGKQDCEKATIKIKYIDFYPEFIPQEHWLYKLLVNKYNVVFSETPDYLFFSCFGNRYLQYNCIRIFVSNEAVYPNLNLCDYAVTYADFSVSDRLLPNQDAFEDLKYKRLANDRDEAELIYEEKKFFCNFVYSNGMGDPYRTELYKKISDYKIVASGGKYLNNLGYRVDNLLEFQSNYKFTIACENSCYKGYTTEKLINAINAKTIPIYWGNEDISHIINSKAIINCHEYTSIEEVVNEIIRLDNDKEAYLDKMMQPLFVDDDMPEKYLQKREQFIYNIIDQPYAEAFRRNRGLRGQWYNDWFCYLLGYPNEWFSEDKNYFVKKKD